MSCRLYLLKIIYLLPAMKRLTNHLLLKRVSELSSHQEADVARECGYVGKGSGRTQLNLFKKALEDAEKPIEIDFGVSISISEGINDFAGTEAVTSMYPSLNRHVINEHRPWLTVVAYFRLKEESPVPIFLVVNQEGCSAILVSDLKPLTESGSITNLNQPSSLLADTANLRMNEMIKAKECSQILGKAFDGLGVPALSRDSGFQPYLVVASLVGCLCARHMTFNHDLMQQVERAGGFPASYLFVPKGYGDIVASYRPTKENAWQTDDEGGDYLETETINKLEAASSVVTIESMSLYPSSGSSVSIGSWRDVEESIDWPQGDMEQSDNSWWLQLIDLQKGGDRAS